MSTALPRRGIPDATVARLPDYLRVLTGMAARGIPSTSSQQLAAAAGVRPAKVRKDLSHLGTHGVRGVGYDVDHLALQIVTELGLARDWPVVIVGMGNLGRALAAYGGLSHRGFRIVGLFDHDPAMVGQVVADIEVADMSRLPLVAVDGDVLGVIATPAESAQEVTDALVAAGVTSILNFAPGSPAVPPHVELRKVDLATELQILAFHKQRRDPAAKWAKVVS
ncbi:MAG: redox-sensing transcriptional repressor Rex [Dermatophilaceae bacterium]